VDTSALAAIENVDDANHKTAMQYREKIPIGDTPFRALYTSNYAIDQTLTLLRIHSGHTVAVEFRKSLEASKLVRTPWVTEALEAAAWKIFEKHADKHFSFTDCTSFALMQAEAIRNAFTFDQNFSQHGFATVP
jgi:hypothetical protein